jgi:hypothetical protein
VPADNGAPISSYSVTALALNGTHWSFGADIDVDGQAAPGTPMGYSFTRLDNHTTYTIVVTAINAAGEGPRAEVSDVSPRGVPDAPRSLMITRGNGSLRAAWSAGSGDGGSPVTGYTVTLTPASGTPARRDVAASAANASFTGLLHGSSYAVSVVATNALGDSPAASATGTPAAVPAKTTRPTATAGRRLATIVWKAPVANGSAVTKFLVRGSHGVTRTVSGSVRSLKFTRLASRKRLSFQVRAVNAVGAGAYSTASAVVRVR